MILRRREKERKRKAPVRKYSYCLLRRLLLEYKIRNIINKNDAITYNNSGSLRDSVLSRFRRAYKTIFGGHTPK